MTELLNVYQYKQLQPLLKEISSRPQLFGRRSMSLRIWAERLGYKSPRSIGMIFDGQRLPSIVMLNKLGQLLKMNPDQREYLLALLSAEKLKKNKSSANEALMAIEKLNPLFESESILDEKKFKYIADWYNLVIKQFITSAYTEINAVKLCKLLKNKVTTTEILQCLENLSYLGIIEKGPKENTYKLKISNLSTLNDVSSIAIRRHHQGMLERAQEALNEVEVQNREFTSATFSFDRNSINEVKEMIRSFRNKLEKHYATTNTEDVFQLNIQFFPHTTAPEIKNREKI